jgi:hypothetical protein
MQVWAEDGMAKRITRNAKNERRQNRQHHPPNVHSASDSVIYTVAAADDDKRCIGVLLRSTQGDDHACNFTRLRSKEQTTSNCDGRCLLHAFCVGLLVCSAPLWDCSAITAYYQNNHGHNCGLHNSEHP